MHTCTDLDIRRWLATLIAEYLHRPADEIATDRQFAEYGLDSLAALTLSVDIEDVLGVTVDPTAVWDHPTVDALAAHLAALR